MRGARKKIKKLDDFSNLYEFPNLLKDDYKLELLKYLLYVEKDLIKSKLFIDEFFDVIPIKVVEDYIYMLCSDNFTNESYSYFKSMNISELSGKSLNLFGELAMSYGEYDVAVACFQQACLSKLPVVDDELKKKLATARGWANKETDLLIRMSLDKIA